MEIFTPFIMCAVFVLASFCFWRLAVKLSSYAARKKILAGKGTVTKEAASVVLISHFGEFAVRPNVHIPMRTGKFHLYSKVDNIIVLPSCIAVVQVETLRGQIFCGSASPVWHQSLRLANGTHQENDFDNPIINNERNIIALSQIFERSRITPPPIYNIIIFSSDKVIFSEELPEVYTLSKAIEKIKALASAKSSKEKKIPYKERKRIVRAVKKHSVSAKKARAHNVKVMRASAAEKNS